MFLSTLSYGKTKTNFIIFDPNVFIRQILSPKIQNVSQDKFIISIFNNKNNNLYGYNKHWMRCQKEEIKINEDINELIHIEIPGKQTCTR